MINKIRIPIKMGKNLVVFINQSSIYINVSENQSQDHLVKSYDTDFQACYVVMTGRQI